MEKIKAEKVIKAKERKNGTPYINKKGENYTLLTIISDGRYYTVWGLTEDQIADFQENDTVEGELAVSGESDHKFYSINVGKKKKDDTLKDPAIYEKINSLTTDIEELWKGIESIEKRLAELESEAVINGDDIPFD